MKFGTILRLPSVAEADAKFENLKNLGFESCQLVYKPEVYTTEDALEIKKYAEKHGIEISAIFCGFRDNYTKWELKYDFRNAGINSKAFGAERLKYLISALPFMNAVGTTDMVIHAGFIPNDPFADDYAEMLCRIKLLADEAKKFGINILLETGGESPIVLLRVIEELNTGNIFVNLDTANLILYGFGNPCEAVITLGKYIRNIHAKDGYPPTSPYVLGPEKAIGEGVVDFKRVFELIKATGYDRFVTIECEFAVDNIDEYLKEKLAYLKNFL